MLSGLSATCSLPGPTCPGPALRIVRGAVPRRAKDDHGWRSPAPRAVCRARRGLGIENLELLGGDVVGLLNFCLYKQIASIVTAPGFPGWLAPLSFSATRFSEFIGMVLTLTGTWVAAGLVVGAYRTSATADLPSALSTASRTWLLAMPVAAAQLVLVTAIESRSLVGSEDFASVLPLAASGIGEPFVTASGVLGLMSLWRCIYSLYLDPFSLKGFGFRRQAFLHELFSFREALLMACLMAAIGSASLQVVHTLETLISGQSV